MYLGIERRSEQSDATDSPAEFTARNVDEAIARGGKVLFLADAAGRKRLGKKAWATVELPKVDPFVAPILYAVPVQLLNYAAWRRARTWTSRGIR